MSAEFANNAEIRDMAEQFATGLRKLHLPAGGRILFAVDQSWQSVAFVWACLGSGLVPVPISPHTTASERKVVHEDLTPAFAVEDPSQLAALRAEVRTEFAPLPRCRPLHMTSGTTGRPKGVWSGWWTDEQAQAAFAEERELWGLSAQDINLVVSGLHHSAPLRFALNTVIAGGALLVPPRFDLAHIRHLITQHQPTTMFCVPTHLKRFLATERNTEPIDIPSFRLVAHAGAPCPIDLKEAAINAFGVDVLQEFYGSTEGQFTICRSRDWLRRKAGVGFARPNRQMFTDDDDQLWCTVPSWGHFEYVGDPERTQAAWRSTEHGRAFTVGDLGRVEPDGWVHIDARRTDLIISGGVNVYPREIEAVIEQFPGVEETAVVGRPHPDWGAEVVAVVVGEVDLSDLRAHVAEQVNRVKIPKEFIVTDTIPHTSTGKIQRAGLLDFIAGTQKG